MSITMPFSDERYMQLLAQGYSDKECAMRMRVKQITLVEDYLPNLLRKAGLSTREEAVVYARHQGYGEKLEGVPPAQVNASLKGVKMAQARAFYRSLEQHFFQNDCPGCKSYFQYVVLLVKGQFYRHMELFLPSAEQDVFELILVLKESDMIHVQKNEESYRVTFKHLLSKEGYHDGDSKI